MKRKTTLLILTMMVVLRTNITVFADEYALDIPASVNQSAIPGESTIIQPDANVETVINTVVTCYHRDLRMGIIELMWQETDYMDLSYTNGYTRWIESYKSDITRNEFYESYLINQIYHYDTY